MKVFLAGCTCSEKYLKNELNECLYLLESFYTLKKSKDLERIKKINKNNSY